MMLIKSFSSPFGISKFQWNYVFRSTISIAIALWLGFELKLDAPFWAMTSAAVVSFPTAGGVLSKSLGRIIGSILGATIAFIISCYCMSSPYLFTFYIAIWLGICTYLSHNYNNNVSYAFALAGYTASIIAFTAINTPDVSKIYDIMQARLTEVMLGIICCTIVSLLIPHDPDDKKLFNGIIKINHQILENAKIFCQTTPTHVIRQSQLTLISSIHLLDITRIQAYWSRSHIRFKNKELNYILHEQLRLLSLTSSMRRAFQQWENKPKNIDEIMHNIFSNLQQNKIKDYFVMSHDIVKQMRLNVNDVTERVLLKKIVHFCRLYNEIQILTDELIQDKNIHHRQEERIHYHIDHIEAIKHGARTALAIAIGCVFSIKTQWSDGGSAMTIASVCCVLYSSALFPINNVLNLIKAFIVLFVFGFIVKFGFFTQLHSLPAFFTFLIPFVFILQTLKIRGGSYASIYAFIIVFFGSFTQVANPPNYDVSSFLNGGIAKIIGAIIAVLAFSLLPSSPIKVKNKRIYNVMKSIFNTQITKENSLSQRHFESMIYSQINQLKHEKSGKYVEILRASFVFINCSYAIELIKKWKPCSSSLVILKHQQLLLLKSLFNNNDIDKTELHIQLAKLYNLSHRLSITENQEARYFAELTWHLYSTLKLLIDYADNKSPAVKGHAELKKIDFTR